MLQINAFRNLQYLELYNAIIFQIHVPNFTNIFDTILHHKVFLV